MELVYLWVKKYKNIKEQGFNFSPKFDCYYDKDKNELIINKNDDYIKNFFGKDINVTAIVGENGSGKSAILEILTNSLSESSKENEIFATDESSFFLIYKYKNDDEIDFFSLKVGLPLSLKITNKKDEIKDITIERLFSQHEDLIGILLNNESASRRSFFEPEQLFIGNTQYHINNIQKIICSNFIKKRNDTFNKDTNKFFIPTKIKLISIYNDDEGINDKITSSIKKFSMDEIVENIKLLEEDLKSIDNRHIIKLKLQNIKWSQLDKKPTLRDFNYQWIEFRKKRSRTGLIAGLKNTTILLHTFNISEIDDNKLEKIFSLKSDLIDIEICSDTKSFKDLSYGERQLLTNLNFILFYAKEKEYKKREQRHDEKTDKVYTNIDDIEVNNILVLLDEFELGLHPNWQKKFIKYITDFLNFIDKKFHLIITSHSPFILSDLPKQNVIFLDKYDSKSKKKYSNLNLKNLKNGNGINVSSEIDIKPFGANIHELLSHGFFMENSLMGEFALDKIQKIVEFYNNVKNGLETRKEYKNVKDEFYFIRDNIGEEYIRDVITNHIEYIEEQLGDTSFKKRRIKLLKQKIKELKG